MKDLLPEGLRFLHVGWWVSHAISVWLVYLWGYRRGRTAQRNARLVGLGGSEGG